MAKAMSLWGHIYVACSNFNQNVLECTVYNVNKKGSLIYRPVLVKDIKKMSSGEQTSSLESFHGVINQFAPKMMLYKYHGMLSIENNSSLI